MRVRRLEQTLRARRVLLVGVAVAVASVRDGPRATERPRRALELLDQELVVLGEQHVDELVDVGLGDGAVRAARRERRRRVVRLVQRRVGVGFRPRGRRLGFFVDPPRELGVHGLVVLDRRVLDRRRVLRALPLGLVGRLASRCRCLRVRVDREARRHAEALDQVPERDDARAAAVEEGHHGPDDRRRQRRALGVLLPHGLGPALEARVVVERRARAAAALFVRRARQGPQPRVERRDAHEAVARHRPPRQGLREGRRGALQVRVELPEHALDRADRLELLVAAPGPRQRPHGEAQRVFVGAAAAGDHGERPLGPRAFLLGRPRSRGEVREARVSPRPTVPRGARRRPSASSSPPPAPPRSLRA